MKIINYSDIPANALGIPGAKDVTVRLLVGAEDGAQNLVMMLLTLAQGGHTPDHHHSWEEEIFVKSGKGIVKTKEGEKPIHAGVVMYFGPDEKHQFINIGSEPLECICMIPRRK